MSSINGFGGDSRSMNGLTTFTGDTIDSSTINCDTLNAITVNADEIYLDGDLLVYPQSVSFNAPFTVTGNAGTNASISDVITTANNLQTHQLTFTIPRGDPGDTTEAEAIANEAKDIAEAAEIEAGLALTEATTAVGIASGAATVAAGASALATTANGTANAAQTDANTGLARTAWLRTAPDNFSTFTGDNRNNPLLPLVDGGSGLKFFNKAETDVFGDITFSELKITISNNGTITQTDGTATLNNLVVNGSSTGVERLKIDNDNTNTQFCIPYTRDIDINDTPPINTKLGVDASFNYNAFTHRLEVPFITSDLSGSASKVVVSSSISTSDLPIAFLSSNTGAVDVLVDIVNGATYKASTNTLTCANFSGDLSGNVSGTATNATNSTITTDSSNQSFFPTFVSATTGNLPLKVDSGISYNPFLNRLSCDVSGNLTGNVSGNLTGNVSGNLTGNVLGSTINIGDPTATDEINIEGRNNCNINIGIASFLNNVNIGNATSSVNIRCITDTAVTVFNPFDQMNGVF